MLRTSAFAAALVLACAGPASAETAKPADAPQHVMTTAEQVKWGAAPASLPAGAQAAVLYGDPAKDGLFVMRLKAPDGYNIPPHTHPGREIVTVISGTFNLGHDTSNDAAKVASLPAGSFFAFDPGMTHYAYAKGETVVQISTMGPWGISYVNPKDDPRTK